MTTSHDGNTLVTGMKKPSVPKLTVISGPNRGMEFPISGEETTIGRTAECDIILTDNNISRKHARIVYISGLFFVYDNESRNGTFVNGKRLVEAQLLGGDVIKVGGSELRFEYDKGTVKSVQIPKAETDEAPKKNPSIKKAPLFPGIDRRTLLYGIALAVIIFTLAAGKIFKGGKSTPPSPSPVSDVSPGQEAPKTFRSTPLTEASPTADLNLGSSDASAYYSTGLIAMQAGNYKEAVANFLKVLALNPDHQTAPIKLKQSRELLLKTIETLYNEGAREFDSLYFERAILQWNKVATLSEGFNETYRTKALGRIEEAKKKLSGITR